MTRSTLIRLAVLAGLPAVLLTVATRAQRGDVDWDAVEIAAGTTAPYEDKWGDPERFLTAVYAELAGEG